MRVTIGREVGRLYLRLLIFLVKSERLSMKKFIFKHNGASASAVYSMNERALTAICVQNQLQWRGAAVLTELLLAQGEEILLYIQGLS